MSIPSRANPVSTAFRQFQLLEITSVPQNTIKKKKGPNQSHFLTDPANGHFQYKGLSEVIVRTQSYKY